MTTELPITEKSAHQCNCGHEHEDQIPTLDAREIPHAIRHATILGAVASLGKGSAMALIAPHNPLPLLGQIRDAHGDSIEISYLSEDPWTLKFARV
jgi:uncharacterized protein (DUF2249 family)